MHISINQPAYLPWPGYFDRIARSDLHVVLDHVQFEKNSFVNRNRILGPNGPLWLTVPVRTKGRFGRLPIHEVEIDNTQKWARKHIQSLRAGYSKAPHFDDCWPELQAVLDSGWERLGDLCRETTSHLLGLLGISTPMVFSSDHDFSSRKSDLVLDICKHFGADVYLSGPFGGDYLELEAFQRHGIKVAFHDYHQDPYIQVGMEFVPNLSVVDLLFNQGLASRECLVGRRSETNR